MRGVKTSYPDEDYEVGADGEDRQAGSDKPLSSKYRGVCWNRKNKRWQAAINSGGKYVYLGSFMSEYDAARAFDKAAVKLRGTRAKLNFSYSEYVDENGNLLEDPTMKNIMYKIEALQGGGGGNSGGAGASGGHKHDSGSDDGNGYPELPHLPLPGLPMLAPRDDAGGAGQHRQRLSPLIHAGKASQQPQQQQQQQPGIGRGLQPPQPLPIDLPGPSSAAMHGAGSSLFGQFGPELHGQGGPLGQSQFGMGRNSESAGLTGLPNPLALPAPMSHGPSKAGAVPQPVPPRPRGSSTPGMSPYGTLTAGMAASAGPPPGGSYDSNTPASLTQQMQQHLAEHPQGFGTVSGAARHPPPSPATQAAILRELPAGSQVQSYVPNRFATNKDETCGVLYSDPAFHQQVGVIVWTGCNHIKMGMYDTERDALQAAIKCMQLYCAFCSDEWRVDFFNALTTMGGSTATGANGVGSSERGAGDCAASAAQHQAGAPPGYGRNGSRGGAPPGSSNNGGGAPPDGQQHQHQPATSCQQQQQPQQQAGAPYIRTSNNGGLGFGPGCGADSSAVGRIGMSQVPAAPAGGGVGYGQGQSESAADACSLQQQQQQQQATQPQQQQTSSQSGIPDLFQYMAGLSRKGNSGDRERSNDAQAHGTKRPAADSLSQLQASLQQQRQQQQQEQQQQQQQQQQQEGNKRPRTDQGVNGGGDTGMSPMSGTPSAEYRAAHKLPLTAMVKQLEQAAAGGR